MRVIVQRVSSASVTVDQTVVGQIERGLLILVAVAPTDTPAEIDWLVKKLASLRIFPDDAGAMNRSVLDVRGAFLVISQFTLFASTRKGTRPSFNAAADPGLARDLYDQFVRHLAATTALPVAEGRFGAHMQVASVNDGPVTLILDTGLRE